MEECKKLLFTLPTHLKPRMFGTRFILKSPQILMNKEVISSALEKVKYPGFSRDIVSFGLVQGVAFENGVASVSIEVTNADPTVPTQIKRSIEDTLALVDGIDEVQVAVVV